MSRKEQLRLEIDLALDKVLEFSLNKLKSLSEKDLEREAHLMGIDILHEACHTLRGRLPKTEKISLKGMKDSWEE